MLGEIQTDLITHNCLFGGSEVIVHIMARRGASTPSVPISRFNNIKAGCFG